MIPDKVIQDWIKNKTRIKDRLNRIKKRLKKLQKQEKHFEMRVRAIQKHEKGSKEKGDPSQEKEDSSRCVNTLFSFYLQTKPYTLLLRFHIHLMNSNFFDSLIQKDKPRINL